MGRYVTKMPRVGSLPEDPTYEPAPQGREVPGMTKTLRMIGHHRQGSKWFGSIKHLKHLKELIADKLQDKMGEFENTGALIDDAVVSLKNRTKKDLANLK